MQYLIRAMDPSEYPLLATFLYEAIFQRDENNLLPRSVIEQPNLQIYIESFGREDDLCLVAECGQEIAGAVWTRILSGNVKGFGYLDPDTPEFAIALRKEYRNKGIGTALMREMLALLKQSGYAKTSLAVQKDNYAVKMYQNVGFQIVDELEEEYLMVCELNGRV